MYRMLRALLIPVVLGALALGAFLALGRDGVQAINPFGGATITVNSTADTNTRDTVITLREAILLATGGLSLNALTESECGQVSPTVWDPVHGYCLSISAPGAASADTIVFDTSVFPPVSPATITLSTILPSLSTGSDTVDGSTAGVIVDGGNRSFGCFTIAGGSEANIIKGLEIYDCYHAIAIFGNTNAIGGNTTDERNIISGNRVGVLIYGSGNTVQGDYIGTDATGSADMGNIEGGVEIFGGAQNNTIGGSTAAERNVISGNYFGVDIENAGTSGNRVRGNYVGTNAAGTAALPNVYGVALGSGAQDNTIGGSNAAERNVISGNNDAGVIIASTGTNGNAVKGSYIGTNAAGTAALPNNTGVYMAQGPQDNTIGGTADGEGNLIALNTGDGVQVSDAATTGNTIRGNSIHSNGGKGIHNDGGNAELAPPVITGFGSVTGTACHNCTIDVYSDNQDEGRVYEGSTTADNAGDWTFDGSPPGPNVTATATDAAGNTSEFSAPVEAIYPTPTPTPTPSPTPGATPTPPAGFTRTLQWGPGWHNVTWTGASTPEEVFVCAAGKYAAAYRFTDAGLERYFPGRPDISNMTPLAQYDAFLILITQPVTCTMPVAAAPGPDRTLQWGPGWHNDGWTGADGTPPEQAFACADGSYAAAYRFADAGLERYFPGRPDISNMGPLNKYDAFLILSTAPVSCTMPIGP